MPNYQETKELIEKEGLSCEKVMMNAGRVGDFGEMRSEEKFFEQVKNPLTGEYFQVEQLKAAGTIPPDYMLPPDFPSDTRFPVIKTNAIFRLKHSDAKEYIYSRATYYGINMVGKVLNKSIDDQEIYERPIFEYAPIIVAAPLLSSTTGYNPFEAVKVQNQKERKIKGVTFAKVYDVLFTPEECDKRFALFPGTDERTKEAVANLVLSNGITHYRITKYRDFRDRDFDELFEYVSTPKVSNDTKMGKEEQDNEVRKRHKHYT